MKTLRIRFTDLGGLGNIIKAGIARFLGDFYLLEESETPELVVFSNYGHDYLNYTCFRLFVSCENVSRISPFKADFAFGCNEITEFEWYCRLPYYRLAYESKELTRKRPQDLVSTWQNRAGVAVVVSNPMGRERNEFWEAMECRSPVASGGHFRNNVGGPVPDKRNFLASFRFCICFENSSGTGYITEKLFDAWLAGCIPIYWGCTLQDGINPKAVIHANHFGDWNQLADHVIEVNGNPELQKQYLTEPLFPTGLPPNLEDRAFALAFKSAFEQGSRLPRTFKKFHRMLRSILEFRKELRRTLRPKWYQSP